MSETTASPTPLDPPIHWPRFAICAAIGLLLWFCPVPAGVEPEGWRVLAVFAATIVSFILRPMPMAATTIIGLVILILTNTFAADSKKAVEYALSGYGSAIVWLMTAAFLISGAVVETGLGRRVALMLIHRLGRSARGLAWGIGSAELVLGPFVASNTARGGGVLAPIVDSLCRTLARGDEVARRNGVSELMILTGSHSNLITSAMFLTGMSANAIVSQAGADIAGVGFGWNTWALGGLVPGVVGLALMPLFLTLFVKPEGVDIAAARNQAQTELKKLGPVSRNERVLLGVFLLVLTLWSTSKLHGIHTTAVALLGVATLLLTGAHSWRSMANNGGAWDAMVWLGGLVTMAAALKDRGVVAWFAENAKEWVGGLGGVTALLGLALIYFYSMYGFSMLSGHITAMAAAFMALAISMDAPPMLTVALLAYFSNLCGCLTNYSSGPVIIYFGMGYVPAARWFRIGALVSLFHMAVWLTVGMAWWKILGWW